MIKKSIRLSASDFQRARKCEKEWLLEKLGVKKVFMTPSMKLGLQLHHEKDLQALNLASSKVFSVDVPIRPKSVLKFNLNDLEITGIPDEVLKTEKTILISEDKTNPESNFQGYLEQLYCYGFLFSRCFEEELKLYDLSIELALRNVRDFSVVESKTYSPLIEKEFLERAFYLKDLLLARIEPVCCNSCSFMHS
ncbi:Uncharacterised protein [uncultured archaeon]|nr:Uncharacterised protein [uncultured archaeon]